MHIKILLLAYSSYESSFSEVYIQLVLEMNRHKIQHISFHVSCLISEVFFFGIKLEVIRNCIVI